MDAGLQPQVVILSEAKNLWRSLTVANTSLLGASAFCSNCQFWMSEGALPSGTDDQTQGQCRADPPVPKPWPKTRATDWCGAWQIKRTVAIETHGPALSIPLGTPLTQVEDLIIAQTLALCDNNKEKAAQLLGVSARTLYRRDAEKKLTAMGDETA